MQQGLAMDALVKNSHSTKFVPNIFVNKTIIVKIV